jgi:predicted adenine nucleotide alpha hydrolase (AANH) superfamily ATPase
MAENYQRLLDAELQRITDSGHVPTLLLHSCCAPCSSYVLEYLTRYFAITVLYYNPNISPADEFVRRAEEQQRLIQEMPNHHPISLLVGNYEHERFNEIAAGHEGDPEGGERCFACYRLRLEEAAKAAKEGGFDYFTTTLSISPLKNAAKLNEIGKELSEHYGVPYLYSDFKKREGYKRSCQLSAEYNLYRQDYCGCVYSKRDAAKRDKQKRQ